MTIERPMFPPTRRAFINTMAALPIAAAAAAAPATLAGASPDAELIELGARFEPLVDQYYRAQKVWLCSMTRAQAEHAQEFGVNHPYTPEIIAAFEECCTKAKVDTSQDVLSEIHAELEHLAKAINASPVRSIDGLRAKALVTFWEVVPLCAGDTQFSFDDAYPFQQLFTAVAELCGLQDKIAATGYELPDIAVDDDDDLGDEEEEA